MSAVVGVVKEHLRSKSSHRRTRSSIDACAPPNPAALDEPYLRSRGRSLRQQALAEEADSLVVSSPKDKKFESVPWEDLKDRQHPDFFSPSATPVSAGPKTPTSAEYANFHNGPTFQYPRVPSLKSGIKAHRRTISTPSVSTESTPAGRRPSLLLKRRPMPLSKSEPSPASSSFPTISELYENISQPQPRSSIDKPLPAEPVSEPESDSQAESDQSTSTQTSRRGVDVLAHRPPRRDSLQNRQCPQIQQSPLEPQPETQPEVIKRPNHIDLPRRLNLPSELHIHTPEYTEALKQWFPAIADKDMHMQPRDKKNADAGIPGITVAV